MSGGLRYWHMSFSCNTWVVHAVVINNVAWGTMCIWYVIWDWWFVVMRCGTSGWFCCKPCVRTTWLLSLVLLNLFYWYFKCVMITLLFYHMFIFLLLFYWSLLPLLALYWYSAHVTMSSRYLDLHLITTPLRLVLIFIGYRPWLTHTTLLYIFMQIRVPEITDSGRVSFLIARINGRAAWSS